MAALPYGVKALASTLIPYSLTEGINHVKAINKGLASDTELIIADSDMHPARVKKLAEQLHANTTLTGIQVTCSEWPHNDLGDNGLEIICKALETNVKVQTLMFNNCKISKAGGKVLADLLTLNPSLTHLNIDDNNLEAEGLKVIAKALDGAATGLQKLSLRGNEIGELGAVPMALLLARCEKLESLGLGSNSLGDEGVSVIHEALKSNSVLKELDLSDNNITQDGCYILANIIGCNVALESIDMSGNHAEGDSDALIANGITQSKTLKTFIARRCRIDQDGAFSIAETLEKNTTLTNLDLRDNAIDEKAMKRLVSVMKVNRQVIEFLVFDPEHPHQVLLNKCCKRNMEDARLLATRGDVTTADMIRRLNWDVDLVRGWLEKLQMRSVIPIFRHHEVDGAKLLCLKLQDLRSMRVESREIRMGLMDAINAVKLRLESLIRAERGETRPIPPPNRNGDLTADLDLELKDLGTAEKDGHIPKLKAQCELNRRRSPLEALRQELAMLTAEEDMLSARGSSIDQGSIGRGTPSTPRAIGPSAPGSATTTPMLPPPMAGWTTPSPAPRPGSAFDLRFSSSASSSSSVGALPSPRTTPRPHSASVRPAVTPRSTALTPRLQTATPGFISSSNWAYDDRPIVKMVRSQYV